MTEEVYEDHETRIATIGKAVFQCPKNGKEVTLHKDCVHCKDFRHWGWHGSKPVITCKK